MNILVLKNILYKYIMRKINKGNAIYFTNTLFSVASLKFLLLFKDKLQTYM